MKLLFVFGDHDLAEALAFAARHYGFPGARAARHDLLREVLDLFVPDIVLVDAECSRAPPHCPFTHNP